MAIYTWNTYGSRSLTALWGDRQCSSLVLWDVECGSGGAVEGWGGPADRLEAAGPDSRAATPSPRQVGVVRWRGGGGAAGEGPVAGQTSHGTGAQWSSSSSFSAVKTTWTRFCQRHTRSVQTACRCRLPPPTLAVFHFSSHSLPSLRRSDSFLSVIKPYSSYHEE